MISAAWYSVVQFKLNLGKLDQLADVIMYIHRTYSVPSDIKEMELIHIIDSLDDNRVNASIENLTNYVPYRLLTPFFSRELTRKPDHQKNALICELSMQTDRFFYKVSKTSKDILVNDAWMEYILLNQNFIWGWLNYKLIHFLQKRNPNVPAIPFKITPPGKRDLGLAGKTWNKIIAQTDAFDIYSDQPFTSENLSSYGGLSIDHFLPWSFVLHDEMWNLVPTFKNINSSKGNRLPSVDAYLDKLCHIQYKALEYLVQNEHSRVIEDYLTLNISINSSTMLSGLFKNVFEKKLKDTILPLYQIAYNQGFEVWRFDPIILRT